MLPRFWTPYVTLSGAKKLGAVTGGADALFRHIWGADLHYGTATDRLGAQVYYQYDRFRPTFTISAEDKTDPVTDGRARSREVTLRATLPVYRTLRASSGVSVAWRRRRETVDGLMPSRLDLGGIQTSWTLGTAKVYPYSISPVDGYRLRLDYLKEAPGLGSDVALGKLVADGRVYARLFRADDAIAAHVAGGITIGRPTFRRSFALGGFADGALFDVVGTNHSVLRGYPDNAFIGRRFVDANLEYRFALAHPQRGLRLAPVFVRHVHATVFADAGEAWSDAFRWGDLESSAGVALGADLTLSHVFPLTMVAGVARGFGDKGETRAYVRAGLAF
jgi:outer membrane protein assembly factor BamA